MSEPVLKKPKIPKETSISEKPMPKPKALASGVSTVKIAGKDVLLKLNEQGVQELHVASFLAVVLNTDDNKASCYWRKKMENDTTLSDKVKKFSREMKFYNLGKIGIGIQFEAAIYILQNVKEKYASLDHCRSIVNELIQMYSGDKQRLWDLWDVFDSTFSDSVPLEEIVPNAKIEQKLVNGIQFLNIFDLLMFACNIKDRFEARRRWKNLLTHNVRFDLQQEIKSELCDVFFRSNPSTLQPGITFPGAVKLIMWLPGSFAREFRSQAAHLLIRYFAGDKHMLKDVIENAQSHIPIFVSCRQSLETTGECIGRKQDTDKECKSLDFFHAIQDNLKTKKEVLNFLYPKQGVVYAMENEYSFPGMFKIGFTMNLLTKRLSQLNVSLPFKDLNILTFFKTFFPQQAESDAHRFFAQYRIQGEFFSIPKNELILYFENKQKDHAKNIVKIQKSIFLKKCIAGWRNVTNMIATVHAEQHVLLKGQFEQAVDELSQREAYIFLEQQRIEIDKQILELERKKFEIEKLCAKFNKA